MEKLRAYVWILLALSLLVGSANAKTFVLPPPGVDVVGEIQLVTASHEDTLMDIARRHSLGYDEIIQANPGISRWLPGEGTVVVLPTRFILPDAPRQGIVLNIAEKRLYYYPQPGPGEKPTVITYPIGVGRMDWKTPLGTTSIVRKQKDPPWFPPESIRAEHAANGDPLPTRVPPGPDNPLGTRALRLGLPSYLIHGTNKQDGVGSMVSHGCIRLWNEHVEALYEMVPTGTTVTIIDQPIKVGWLAGILFMETHGHLPEDNIPNNFNARDAMDLIRKKLGEQSAIVDNMAVELVVEQASGLVVPVSGLDT